MKILRLAVMSAIGFGLLSTSAMANPYVVEVNKASLITLPRPAATIIIGNPAIADVQVQTSSQIVITGKNYGETNVMIFDADGQPILNTDIAVTLNQSAFTRIIDGTGAKKSYQCNPICQPSPGIGDDPVFFTQINSAYETLNAQADAAALSSGQGQ